MVPNANSSRTYATPNKILNLPSQFMLWGYAMPKPHRIVAKGLCLTLTFIVLLQPF